VQPTAARRAAAARSRFAQRPDRGRNP